MSKQKRLHQNRRSSSDLEGSEDMSLEGKKRAKKALKKEKKGKLRSQQLAAAVATNNELSLNELFNRDKVSEFASLLN